MHISDFLVLLFLIAGAGASVYWKKLTPAAALTGVLVGAAIYAGGGYPGLLCLALFFVLGTAATTWKKKDKLLIEGNAGHQPTRTSGQVIANAGVAAIAGLLAFLLPAHRTPLQPLIAAAFSAAAADTLSSELGMVYGRRFINILTGKPDRKGEDGVVSIEGFLFGLAGSALIAIAWCSTTAWSARVICILLLAGTAGNIADSLLGALLERKGVLSNNTVNFLNTLAAGLLAALFF